MEKVTRSLALHSCLWIDIFSFTEPRSSADPFNIPISNQLHMENHVFPVFALQKILLSLLATFHWQVLMKNTQTVSCVWPSPLNNIWYKSGSLVWFQSHGETEFRTHTADWFGSDCRKLVLKKDEIPDLMLYFSKPHQLWTHSLFWPCAVLLPTHLGTTSLNLPLADLCFRCALLSWQVRPKAETGRAEGATCTTQSLLDEELGITAPQFVPTKALVLPASWHSSNTSLELRQQHGKMVVCYHHCTRNALVLKGLNAKKLVCCAWSTPSLSTLLKLERMPGQSGKLSVSPGSTKAQNPLMARAILLKVHRCYSKSVKITT